MQYAIPAVRSTGLSDQVQRLAPLLFLLAAVLLLMLLPDQAHASSTGTGGLEWESPLQKFGNSIKGPVAFIISLMGIVVCGCMLIWGGEINEFVRRFIMLILVISTIVFAASILANLFGVGAVIDATQAAAERAKAWAWSFGQGRAA
ncbi:TrbC/VirB2 family protein [Pseudomonas chlororaphis]|uniref:TrbC/VirB2 family protein n=1 Tax=Pseudomonas chlororaphis TaxID=587753 RepID=UPI002407A1F5|nr:TrbC/VirB2 family protein [Pseudomonas chlororaphis]